MLAIFSFRPIPDLVGAEYDMCRAPVCHSQVFDGRSFALGGTNSARFVPVETAGAPGAPFSEWSTGAAETPWSANGRSDGRFPGGMHSDRCKRAGRIFCRSPLLLEQHNRHICSVQIAILTNIERLFRASRYLYPSSDLLQGFAAFLS